MLAEVDESESKSKNATLENEVARASIVIML